MLKTQVFIWALQLQTNTFYLTRGILNCLSEHFPAPDPLAASSDPSRQQRERRRVHSMNVTHSR